MRKPAQNRDVNTCLDNPAARQRHGRRARSLGVAGLLACLSAPWATADTLAPAQGPVPGEPPLSAKYLPAYLHLVDGLSWAAHIDSEWLGNMSGGLERKSFPDLVGQIGFEYDTEKAGLWSGGMFTVSVLGVSSGGSEPDIVGDIQTASNIWSTSLVRLYDLAYSQEIGRWATLRAGIMDVNYYFDVTGGALQLINSSFGITPTMTANVPVATYPYSGLGAMVGAHGSHWGAKMGVFQGNPQFLSSAFDDGYMAIAEVGGHWQGDDEDSARYVLKAGAWHYEQPKPEIGNSTSGVYGVAEARWDLAGERNLEGFLQLGGAPQDFNPVPWYLGAGLRLKGTFPSRPNDIVSVGMARAWVRGARMETAYEGTYVAQLTDKVFIQPDLQYIAHPAGVHPDALVGILRLHVEFF